MASVIRYSRSEGLDSSDQQSYRQIFFYVFRDAYTPVKYIRYTSYVKKRLTVSFAVTSTCVYTNMCKSWQVKI